MGVIIDVRGRTQFFLGFYCAVSIQSPPHDERKIRHSIMIQILQHQVRGIYFHAILEIITRVTLRPFEYDQNLGLRKNVRLVSHLSQFILIQEEL